MMKKNLFWLIVIILTGSLLTMTSCSDDDISTEDPFLVTALKQRFPNSVSIDEAEIIFVSKQRVAEILDEIEDCQLKGGLVVIFDPGLDNGWDIPDYTPVEGVTDIFFAANNYEQYYTMVGEPEDDIVTTEGHAITPEEQAQIDASVAYGMQNPDEDPILANMEKEEYDYPSVEYFNNRLTPFIDWIEEMDAINAEENENVTKASLPQVPSYKDIKICPVVRITDGIRGVWFKAIRPLYTILQWRAHRAPAAIPAGNPVHDERARCRTASCAGSVCCICRC
jgi:hypothetical protein